MTGNRDRRPNFEGTSMLKFARCLRPPPPAFVGLAKRSSELYEDTDGRRTIVLDGESKSFVGDSKLGRSYGFGRCA